MSGVLFLTAGLMVGGAVGWIANAVVTRAALAATERDNATAGRAGTFTHDPATCTVCAALRRTRGPRPVLTLAEINRLRALYDDTDGDAT